MRLDALAGLVLGALGACGHSRATAPPHDVMAPDAMPLAIAPAPAGLEDLDALVHGGMRAHGVPGLAMAVVRDGVVVLLRVYGFRDKANRLPVTPKTRFAIGSITKSMTATLLGTLVDEGKLDWDKPVREYLPSFRLFDPVATERATARDLVTHRTGVPAHDLAWYGASFTREELMDRLRYLEPSADLRVKFQYNNLMLMAAGVLAGRIAGTSWEELLRRRLLEPLGMTNTDTSIIAMQRTADFALPYAELAGEVRRVPFADQDAIGPAGSVNSSIEDMARYLIFCMGDGTYGGRRVVSAATLRELHTPQIPEGMPAKFAERGEPYYALGSFVESYRNRRMVSHPGGIDGFVANIAFLADEKVGVVVLSNRDDQSLPEALSLEVLDRMLHAPSVDWIARHRALAAARKKKDEGGSASETPPRKPSTRPSHPLADYAGDFAHAAYGTIRIAVSADGLVATFHEKRHALAHVHCDVFATPADPRGALDRARLEFRAAPGRTIDALLVPLDGAVKPIVFGRRR